MSIFRKGMEGKSEVERSRETLVGLAEKEVASAQRSGRKGGGRVQLKSISFEDKFTWIAR